VPHTLYQEELEMKHKKVTNVTQTTDKSGLITFCKDLMKEQHKRKVKKMVKHLKRGELWVLVSLGIMLTGVEAYALHKGIDGKCLLAFVGCITALGGFCVGRHIWKK
jgi:hypothetical protein